MNKNACSTIELYAQRSAQMGIWMSKYLKPLELKNIKITDELFSQYVKSVSTKIIPYQWKMLNNQIEDADSAFCIQNFRIAAGEVAGKRKGVVFQDTDLYKWLESVAFCLASGQGQEYEEIADDVIDLIGKAQEEDGYVNTYYTVNAPHRKWTNLVEGHELYTAGHLIEAAVAYYQATKKERLLQIAKKNADLICSVFGTGEGQIRGYPGHQEIELALIKLYRVTQDRKYLETAHFFIEERGKEPNYLAEEIKRRGGAEFFPEFSKYDLQYSQSHIQPKKQKEAVGHAVRAVYMCVAMVDLAEEYDNKELLEACQSIWDNMVNKRMYITGGIGTCGFKERFTADYDLPNNTNYSESCASIGLMMFGQRMASVMGNAKYYDVVEKALYNTVLAGININGDRYFYVNPLEVVPEFCTEYTYMDHVKAERQKWYHVACCPTNIARTLASLGQYIYAEDEEAVYIHQFISSTAKTFRGEDKLEIEMKSKLLQSGTVTITTLAKEERKIKIRIPHYAEDCKILVNGESINVICEAGYCLIALSSGSNSIMIDFGIKPRWVTANGRVRADIGKAALVKGPMVYCLEEIDNGDLLSEIYVEENAAISENPPEESLIGNLPTLTYQGIRLKNRERGDEELYGQMKYEQVATKLKAVPYCMWNNRGGGEMLVWQKVKLP